MKKISILTILILMSFNTYAQGIKFEQGTFNEAINKANKENKLVFIDFYTVWCGPCKLMSANIFPTKKAGDYFNDKFVSIKIDAEKGEGVALAKKYGVQVYPTFLYINSSDKSEIGKIVGAYKSTELFIEATKETIGDSDDNLKFPELYEIYGKEENKDPEFIKQLLFKGSSYIRSLDRMEMAKLNVKLKNIAKTFFTKNKPELFFNEKGFSLISSYLSSGEDYTIPYFEFVCNNYEAFKEFVSVEELAYYIKFTNRAIIFNYCTQGNPKFRNHIEAIKGNLKQAYAAVPPIGKGDQINPYLETKFTSEASFALSQNDYNGFLDWTEKNWAFKKNNNLLDANSYWPVLSSLLIRAKGKLSNKQVSRCLKIVNKALKLDEKEIHLLEIQGDLFALQGEKNNAITSYNKAINFAKGTRSEAYTKQVINKKIKDLKN